MMLHTLLNEAVQRERARQVDRAHRAGYARRVILARRRQRKADAAHRALAAMVVR